ncbi:MAG: hypothetical protein WC809_21025 [Sinimarinibacterium sp.]|jgi:uncharacterized membrane protein YqgA involved in biofilm formation
MPLSTFQAAKLAVASFTGLEKDALHIYVGLGVFFAIAVLSRRSARSILPWLAVLVVALFGEAMDLRDGLMGLGAWHWTDSVHDILNTLFWPTILVVLGRSTSIFGAADD